MDDAVVPQLVRRQLSALRAVCVRESKRSLFFARLADFAGEVVLHIYTHKPYADVFTVRLFLDRLVAISATVSAAAIRNGLAQDVQTPESLALDRSMATKKQLVVDQFCAEWSAATYPIVIANSVFVEYVRACLVALTEVPDNSPDNYAPRVRSVYLECIDELLRQFHETHINLSFLHDLCRASADAALDPDAPTKKWSGLGGFGGFGVQQQQRAPSEQGHQKVLFPVPAPASRHSHSQELATRTPPRFGDEPRRGFGFSLSTPPGFSNGNPGGFGGGSSSGFGSGISFASHHLKQEGFPDSKPGGAL